MSQPPRYPDISDILANKAKSRRAAAARTFAEKLDVLERLREKTRPLRDARSARTAEYAAKKLAATEQS